MQFQYSRNTDIDDKAWLQLLLQQWKKCHREQSQSFDVVFERFVRAMFSFHEYILPIIRDNLNPLDENSDAGKNYIPANALNGEAAVKDLQEKLQAAWDAALYQCSAAVRGFSPNVNGAKSAAIESFVDGLVRHGGFFDAKADWSKFYRRNCPSIWKEDYAQLAVKTQMRNEWNEHLSAIKKLTTTP